MKSLLAIVSALVCASVSAQDMFSPKLIDFLLAHPSVSQTLSNAMASARSGRMLQIYYFYASNAASPRSHHNYIGNQSVVGIFVRENQPACDECISILYELLNAGGEKDFLRLFEAAKSGTIKREDFVTELLRKEFEAVQLTHKLILNWKLDAKTAANSQTYQYFVNAPEQFENFLAYSRKSSQALDQKNYDHLYDSIQRTNQ
jgi:hypothetical protein